MSLRRILHILVLVMWLFAMSGYAGSFHLNAAGKADKSCHLVIEEGTGFTAEPPYASVEPGQSAVFILRPAQGYEISAAKCRDGVLTRLADGSTRLIVDPVRYSHVITVTTRRLPYQICYHANGGQLLSCNDTGQSPGSDPCIRVFASDTHLRVNTDTGTGLFTREGHTLTGWSTQPDGQGTRTGLGSRVRMPGSGCLDLYAIWEKWTDESLFEYSLLPSGIRIDGWHGQETELVIPEKIGQHKVTSIAERAFAGASCVRIVLPPSLREVGLYAFEGSQVREVVLYDTLYDITDYSFYDCPHLRTIRINAARPPVYSGSYYDTFPDKYDRLLSLADTRKLVLFSGSSTRFGYDSSLMDTALEDYDVVNMGVFAYTNALPQLELIRPLMRKGDILLVSPEFDAAKRQFCTTNAFDEDFFCMIEGNYDLLSLLDISRYSNVLNAFHTFQVRRSGMQEKNYALSPSMFDEDMNPVSSPSYNEYGDYIVPRPDSTDDAPIYGLPVDYTAEAFPLALYIEPANTEYRLFLDRGIRVFFTYAPRNSLALSDTSTPAARARLDRWLRESLIIPVISPLEESLFPGHLLSGTDNHLSDNGVQLRTRRVLRDLQNALGTDNDKEVLDEPAL